MTDDRWADTIDRIVERFTILERGVEEIPDIPRGRREMITFTTPMGRVRLTRTTKPRTIGQRALTSRRFGGSVRVEMLYDHDDLVHVLTAERWDESSNAWVSIDASTVAP